MNLRRRRYVIFGSLVCLYLALANHYGWSPWHAVAARTWAHRQPGAYHK